MIGVPLKPSRLRRPNRIVAAFLLGVGVLMAGVWHNGYRQALEQLARRAEADLALASDRLSSQLQIYQEIAVMTADHPALQHLTTPGRIEAANRVLRRVADKSGARDVLFADTSGRVMAGATEGETRSIAGTPYFRRAMNGALGTGIGPYGSDTDRAYFYAAPTFEYTGGVSGVLVFVADVELIERGWRGDTPAVFFTDSAGEVFISNRSELLFWRRAPGQVGISRPSGGDSAFDVSLIGGHEVWHLGWGPYLPERALHLSRDLPVLGLGGEVLVDVAPVRRMAWLQAFAVGGICLAFGALLYLAGERRRNLARANAVLEARVSERTAELSEANRHLREEVIVRQEAEAALKQAQADLVQAGKLSALGQMSAGISHELNQPLMAIRSFADNGSQFLDRGRTDVVAENLGRISMMAARMARIIRNLRAFARNESEPVSRVDLVQVVASAIEMTEARLRSDAVTLDWDAPPLPVYVRGGEVRLGQVVVNLITNAADAMARGDRRRIAITLDDGGDRVRLKVRDHGPGIAAPEKLFEPFYTTKAVGSSEGMGLGLSISYGLVQSFGGDIRGENLDDGAVFTVTLDRWDDSAEAAA
ncbi:MAG: C4-dicarboxylate ABC transporter [Pseudooceanicola sp.]|nr:C4-dicarboxylate ABC transporter [Pseudooceanicola sp.]